MWDDILPELTEIMKEEKSPTWLHWLPMYKTLYQTIAWLQPKIIVEIGVRAGQGSWSMFKASPGCTIFGIDFDGDESQVNTHGGYKGLYKRALEINKEYNFHLWIMNSHHIERLPDSDVTYIDGDHTEEGVWLDLLLAEKSSKVILLDDYFVSNLGIKASVDRFMNERPNYKGESIDNGCTGLYMIIL